MNELKASQKRFEESYKALEVEDLEFLGEIEKERKMKYEEGKKRLYSVIERRRKKWNLLENERKCLKRVDIDFGKVEYSFFREETIKTEEKLINK